MLSICCDADIFLENVTPSNTDCQLWLDLEVLEKHRYDACALDQLIESLDFSQADR